MIFLSETFFSSLDTTPMTTTYSMRTWPKRWRRVAKREIWGPLGMADTTYNPPASLVPRCAATGPGSLLLRPGPLRGTVQDDQDWKVGGIVGCDGVFATARNVAIFSQMILNGGSYGDVRVLPKKLVAAMVANQ